MESTPGLDVKLTFFKLSGKYYSGATYRSTLEPGYGLGLYWDEVESLRKAKDPRTGLSSGGCDFYCLVEVPEHDHAHPILLHPLTVESPAEAPLKKPNPMNVDDAFWKELEVPNPDQEAIAREVRSLTRDLNGSSTKGTR